MLLGKPFARFVEESPISVMMRGIVEYAFEAKRLNDRGFWGFSGKKILGLTDGTGWAMVEGEFGRAFSEQRRVAAGEEGREFEGKQRLFT